VGLDRQRHRLARRRQILERPRRAMHEIADAVDVEDQEVLADAVDGAGELADHGRRLRVSPSAILRATLRRWWAWVMAIASASAASWEAGAAFGSNTPSIMRICALSQWPTPTIVFLTRFGAYSATVTPALAGTTRAMPRAWPSLRVAAASLL